jgi:X-Pro dipeptidyl-peptidase
VPAKIWLNQGGHGDGANSGTRQAAWRDELNRFWSQYLFGVDNNWTGGPRAAVQRENSQWVDYADWPAPNAKKTKFYLGAVGDNTVGEISVDPLYNWDKPSGGLETIVDDSSIDANVLIAAAQSPNRLVYKTGVLNSPVHMSGIPSVSLCLSFDQPAAVVSAAVVEYREDGTARLVTRGWADPQNHKSISKTTPIKAGAKEYEITFELQPHDYEFRAGSRIGLVVMSTDRLFTLRPPAGTRLTLHPGNSKAYLPIVGGAGALRTAMQ